MDRTRIVLLVSLASFAFACSEASDVAPKDASTKDTGSDVITLDATAPDSSPSDASVADGAGIGKLVFNELSATGGDWIEIYNTGSDAVDVSGYKLADNEIDAAAPRLAQALVFASGTTIAPGGYLVVIANEKVASPSPQPCFDGGVKPGCPAATWGVSKDTPNKIYLLAPNDAVALDVDMAANVHVSGESWGRFPNGTGVFAVAKPTPGKANEN